MIIRPLPAARAQSVFHIQLPPWRQRLSLHRGRFVLIFYDTTFSLTSFLSHEVAFIGLLSRTGPRIARIGTSTAPRSQRLASPGSVSAESYPYKISNRHAKTVRGAMNSRARICPQSRLY